MRFVGQVGSYILSQLGILGQAVKEKQCPTREILDKDCLNMSTLKYFNLVLLDSLDE